MLWGDDLDSMNTLPSYVDLTCLFLKEKWSSYEPVYDAVVDTLGLISEATRLAGVGWRLQHVSVCPVWSQVTAVSARSHKARCYGFGVCPAPGQTKLAPDPPGPAALRHPFACLGGTVGLGLRRLSGPKLAFS